MAGFTSGCGERPERPERPQQHRRPVHHHGHRDDRAHSHGAKKVRFRCDFCPTMRDVLKDRGWTQVVDGEDDSWNLFWCEVHQLRTALDHKRLEGHQKVHHFRNHYELTRKNLLNRNLRRLRRQLLKQGRTQEAAMCDCMPVTFELPSEHLMFVEEYRRNPGMTWIVKPSGGRQGKGIFLFQRLKELNDWKIARDAALVTGSKPSSRGAVGGGGGGGGGAAHGSGAGAGASSTLPAPDLSPPNDPDFMPDVWVVQRYIERPYLISGKKFDIRFYVLVTSFRPLKVWMAREGFARLCGEPYNLRSLGNQRGHLTNMSIQLKPENDSQPQGCKWSLERLRHFLSARHGPQAVDRLMQRVAHVVLTSLRAVQPTILQDKHCFELYGYDVLLDDELNPWLLEVNASPSLTPTDAEDYRLKYDLLEDVLNVLDLEGRLTGQERQVGGMDLLWDDGPVFRPCPEGSCGVVRPQPSNQCRPLNVLLGCHNNRVEQLQELEQWRAVLAQHAQQQSC